MKNELANKLNVLKNMYSIAAPNISVENIRPISIYKANIEISARVDGYKDIRPSMDLMSVLDAVSKYYKKIIFSLTREQQKDIPFILFSNEVSISMMRFLLDNCINYSSEIQVKKLLYVFFENYDQNEKIDVLKDKLLNFFENKSNEDFRKRALKFAYEYRRLLFQLKPEYYFGKLIEQNGFDSALITFGIADNVLRRSKFVNIALGYFFAVSDNNRNRFDVFSQLNKLKFSGYETIKPLAISNVIILADNLKDEKWKDWLINYCNKTYGDPRVKSFNWISITAEAKKVYIKWLAANDLELFFNIIQETAVDRMWRYRNKFWQVYLPYITNSWVYFGSLAEATAQRITKKKVLSYGLATQGVTPNQSAFVFEIGDYVFCEWSHNGKLYIWRRNTAPVEFGGKTLSKFKVTSSLPIDSFVHSGSESYHWQNNVRDWIAQKCNIYIDMQSYKLPRTGRRY